MSDAANPDNQPAAPDPRRNWRDFGIGQFKMLLGNPISLAGSALAIIALANILFFFLIDFLSPRPNPYIGILAYMVLPAFLVAGLALIPTGLILERRRIRRAAPGTLPRFPILDLNIYSQRKTLAAVLTFGVVFVILSAFGSYRAFEYTESVEFCGQLCHSVMNPEHVAYKLSPHARVRCVDCHVGSGASWYVRSKLSGARQVVKTIMGTFPRPIPSPVENLRPAADTCEACHWPGKFHGAQLRVFTHFAADEKNTPRQVRLLIKTGGGDPRTGPAEGIHWHMNIANEITYAASDAKRQVIPYIRVKDPQGRVTEFLAKDANVTTEQGRKMTTRRMDCVDCHNRPTHVYVPPDRAIDQAMTVGNIDPSIPSIKQESLAVLTTAYESTPKALEGIATSVHQFYQSKYPQVESQQSAQLQKAIAELQRIYQSTTFPEMKLDWKTHPDNIGHFYYQGCFRCHDGQHQSADGRIIRKDCDLCHTMLGQDEGQSAPMAKVQSVPFQHPVDLGDMTQVNCSDCHTGGPQ